MAGERRSLQDLIRGRQRGGFVGRQGQIVQYQENLALPLDSERRQFLFNIHGDAGVGKTYLSKQLRQNARDSGALTAYSDETADDCLSVMTVIAEELARSGARLGEFSKRVAAYRQRRHELESDPQAPDGVATFVTKTAVTVALAAGRDVPIAGSLLAPLDAAAIADQADRARAYLARKFANHGDIRLLLSPADVLTPVFVADLNRAAADRQIALFFDTYERTAPLLDHWLRDLYAGKYGDLPGALITTISGQYPLDPNLWGDYLPVIADVPLEPFSEAEARQFLGSKNITDELTIEVILNLSGRLPMWLATLAEARPADAADIGDPAGDAVGRFLKWEDDPARRAIAISAALPRTFNQDVLNAVTPSDHASELFGWLCGLPFVVQQARSWKYHDVVRSAMLRLQHAQSPAEWRAHHLALARAHARWAAEAASGADPLWANPDWVDHAREETYHLLCADPAHNLPQALGSAARAAECGVARARQWATLFADAARDADHADLRRWAQWLGDGIGDGDLTRYLTHLVNDAGLDQVCMAIALQKRGENYRLTFRYDDALADYTRAIELDPGLARAYGGRGLTYQAMGRYDDALADYGRGIELDPSYAWAVASRGETYRLTGRYDEALADYGRAIEIDPRIAWAFASRGLTHQAMGRHNEALADYARAIELDAGYARAFGSRGLTYQAMGRYDEALADYGRAIEIDPGIAWVIASRGLTCQAMGRYDEALADLGRAIDVDPSYAWIASRGRTYQAMGRYDEALADYARAIEIDPGIAWAIASRGDTYRLTGRYDEALADFSRAIELDPGYAWAVASRGDTYRLTGRYDEALADYGRAIELAPSYAWAVGSRGRTYQAMGRYDDAIADYGRAIELDPGIAWAIASRGETYRLTGRYDEALADLDRAIELDAQIARAFGSRGLTLQAMGRYGEAIADFGRAIELDPGIAWVIASRGDTYRLTEDYDQALADYAHAIDVDPGYPWAIASRGETYRLTRRYDEALSEFTHAIELDPGYAWAIARRADTYRLTRRYDEAIADYSRAIELDPGTARAFGGRGLAYQAVLRNDDAIADYSRAIELDPSYSLAIARRGDAYLMMGRYEDAFTDLNRAIELEPGIARAFGGRGLTYQVRKEYDKAIADYSRAIELDPGTAWIVASRGDTCRLAGRYDEALADLNRAIELDPSLAWAIASRGETYMMMERYDEALGDLRRAIELDPNYSTDLAASFVSMAADHLRNSEPEAAAAIFETIISVTPNDATAHNNYAFCLMPVDPVTALGELERADKLSGDDLTTLANRVLALHLLGRNDEALAIGASENARNLPSNNSLMWISYDDDVLQLSDWIDVREYLVTLLAHIESERGGEGPNC